MKKEAYLQNKRMFAQNRLKMLKRRADDFPEAKLPSPPPQFKKGDNISARCFYKAMFF